MALEGGGTEVVETDMYSVVGLEAAPFSGPRICVRYMTYGVAWVLFFSFSPASELEGGPPAWETRKALRNNQNGGRSAEGWVPMRVWLLHRCHITFCGGVQRPRGACF